MGDDLAGRLACIFAEVLEQPAVGIDDHFFELGGTSLLAAILQQRIEEVLGAEVPLATIFEADTPRGIARSLAPADVPLSYAQQRMWFLHQLAPADPAYNLGHVRRIRGPFDRERMRRALEATVARHAALRTTYAARDGVPYQVVAPASRFELPIEQIAAPELDAAVARELDRPFELAASAFRARVLELAADDHVVVLAFHHIAADDRSLAIVWRDVHAAYGGAALAPAPAYADYAIEQRARLTGDALARELEFWRTRLADAPAMTELPYRVPKPSTASRATELELDLGIDTARALRAIARSCGATPFVACLALVRAGLARALGLADVCLGTPISNRDRSALGDVVGMFVNTIALRAPIERRATFRDHLKRERELAFAAYAHREAPFEHVVQALGIERRAGINPVFQISYSHQQAEAAGELGEPVDAPRTSAQFDLELETWERGDSLALRVTFKPELFEDGQIERLAGHLATVARAVVRDPDVEIRRAPMLDASELAQLEAWHLPAEPGAPTVTARFEAQVDRTPGAIAIAFGDAAIDYRTLDARANGIARALHERGIGAGDVVGIALERSPEQIAAVLGVLKAGAAYVPLDPRLPAARLAHIARTSRMALSIGAIDLGVPALDVAAVAPRAERAARPIRAEHVAYVLFTSGSTGAPKGVLVPHRAIVNELEVSNRALVPIGPGDATLQLAPFTFDQSVHEILWPLVNGARLVLVADGEQRDPAAVLDRIRSARVTVVELVPSLLRALVAEPALRACDSLRLVAAGGEPLPLELARAFHAVRPDVPLVNGYGPTETAVTVCNWRCSPDATAMRIGAAWPGVRFYVVDDVLELVPIGVAGELYIAGCHVAHGYAGRPDLTAERFVPDPFGGGRMYRTGDRVRRHADGTLEFLGRVDEQVKLRGYRIELGEIEAALRTHRAVADCAVAIAQTARGDALTAYVVGEVDAAALRAHAATLLPDYMVPALYVALPALPLTASGKLDHRALPPPDESALAREAGIAPRTDDERALAAIWSEVLGVPEISVDHDFFALGGHSLLATQVVARVRGQLHVAMTVRHLYDAPTIEKLARKLATLARNAVAKPAPVARRSEDLPLSYAQQRLWLLDRMLAGTTAYHIPWGRRIHGAIDREALRGAFEDVVRRHEILRTVFPGRGGLPVQRILPAIAWELPLDDLTGLPADARDTELRACSRRDADQPFDLETGPLMRTRLVKLSPAEHVLLITMHHMIADGWSCEILLREVAACYGARVRGTRAELPALALQYADYAAQQRSSVTGAALAAQLAYWKTALADAPVESTLPLDMPRAPSQHAAGEIAIALGAGVTRALRELGHREGVTTFVALLAAFRAVVARTTGQDDLVIGTPIANRERKELEALIGLFVNTIALRGRPDRDASFAELVRREREITLAALAHQDAPFEMVVDELHVPRDPLRTPIFQIWFVQESVRADLARIDPAIADEAFPRSVGAAKFDLSVYVNESSHDIELSLVFDTSLFERASIADLADRLRRAIELGAGDPDRVFAEHALGAPAGGDPREPIARPSYPPVLRVIEDAVRAEPGAPALQHGATVMTRDALWAASGAIADAIVRAGLVPGDRVALSGAPSPGLIAAFLGILRSGTCLVPLSSRLSRDHADTLLERVDARLVLHAGAGANVDPETAAVTLPPVTSRPGDPAIKYIYFTSGSTGAQKGVAGNLDALAQFTAWQRATYGELAGPVVAQLTELGFDVFLREVMFALTAGKLLALPPRGTAELDPAELVRWLERAGVTALHTVPSLARAWLAGASADARLADLRCLFVVGEPLDGALVTRWRDRFRADTEVINFYGTTETGPAKLHYRVPRPAPAGIQPIGAPLPETRVSIVRDGWRPCTVGEVGELVIRTAFSTLGYLDGDRGSFVANPFRDDPRDIAYRTGDLARCRRDGTIALLGRVDDQVKIRGQRVDPAGVAVAIRAVPGVHDAAVIADGDRLAAYVVGGPPPGELRAALRAMVPAYMIPASFIALPALPRKPNGKLDRAALPSPDWSTRDSEFVPPRSPEEEAIAAIWCEVLGIERIGVRDDFFARGGHSLLAVLIISRVRALFDVELGLQGLFAAPTIEAMAADVARARADAARSAIPPIVRVPRDRELPLSYAQQRMWFLQRLAPTSPAYNVALGRRLHGALASEALRRSLDDLIRRHEGLRAVFPSRNGAPVQRILDELACPLPIDDLAALPPGERDAALERIARDEAERPFDLANGPLLRARLVRLASDDQVLMLTLHHIVSDGWSMGVVWTELAELYRAHMTGAPPRLPAIAIHYADFATWQRRYLEGGALARQLAYWTAKLADAPPESTLPALRPRPAVSSARGAVVSIALDATLEAQLRAYGRRASATKFVLLLAAFRALLARIADRDDLVIGSPIANRNRKEVEPIVGLMLNTLALRTRVDANATFGELVAAERATTLEAYANQDAPFEMIVDALTVDRALDRTPVFQISFVHQNTPQQVPPLGDLVDVPYSSSTVTSRFDLSIVSADSRIDLVYNADLYDRWQIEQLGEQYLHLLGAVLREPDRRLAHVSAIAPDERERLITRWNRTPGRTSEQTLPDLVEAQVDRTPGAVAVVAGDTEVTYAELDARANRIANALCERGVGPEVVVAIALERSVELVAAILGVTKAGGAWVPLDPHLPAARREHIAQVARPALVIDDPAFGAGHPAKRPGRRGLTGDHLAYVLFTSGSTGRPKGAMIHHRGIVNELVSAQALRAQLDRGDAFLQLAPYTFDLSVHEMMWPLSAGARVVVMREGDHRDPQRILDEIAARRVTIMHPVPTLLRALLERGLDRCTSLRVVVSGGEAMPLDVLRTFFARRPDLALVNSYGPTETSVTVSQWHARADATAVAIGTPWLDTQLYVLDAQLEPSPIGSIGELYIAGRQVGRGYMGQRALTAERFVPDPFATEPGARMYRSGDRARRWPDGNLELVGRGDGQVKLRGFRIELGEIVAVLREHPAVREAIVVLAGAGEAARLVGYVVASGAWSADALREHLAARLPEYMVPKLLVRLDAMPLTASGKIDRAQLPPPDETTLERAGYEPPRTPLEELLAGIWSELLGIDRIGRDDNFFEIGGHSLLAARLAWEAKVTIATVFAAPTIAELAAAIERGVRVERAPPAIEPVARDGELPLAYAQQRMWFLQQLAPASSAYHIGVARRLRGTLDVAALERAIERVVARHDSLRTVFPAPGGVPHQLVRAPSAWSLRVIDAAEHELESLSTAERERPFDLEHGPLLRTLLVRLAPDDHVLFITLHHIIADGWSIDVLWRELAHAYSGRALGELAVQYVDHAAWQRAWLRGDVLDAELAFWRARLAGAAEQLELPTKAPRAAVRDHHGASLALALDRELVSRLHALSRAHGSTLFITLMAAFRALLYRYTGQRDVCIGVPVANRSSRELEALIGLFVNTLVFRTPVAPSATFAELLGAERVTALEAFAHREAPFEMVVEALGVARSLTRNPVFQVMFQVVFAEPAAAPGFAGLADSYVERTLVATQLDLDLTAVVVGDAIELSFVYSTELFDRELIERFAGHFRSILEAAAGAPDTAVEQLAMLAAGERAHLVGDWNRSAREIPHASLPELIDAWADRTPDAIAIASRERALRYRELRARTNRLAHHLRRRGLGRDERVGISLERGPDLVVAMLGVLKAGGAYLPIDPQLPAERRAYMASDAKLAITLSELDDAALAAEPEVAPAIAIEPDHLAYVLYTSGSTGRPKGVQITHGALVNFLAAMREAPGLAERATLLAVTTASFDISGLELYLPLVCGGRTFVASRDDARDGARLQALLAETGATQMQATPATWRLLVETGWRGGRDFVALCGGEALPPDLAAALAPRVGELWNMYGPTETTIWSARKRVVAGQPIRLGEPIANTRLYVVEPTALDTQPLDVAGELFIAGDGLARGYLDRPGLTAERFLPDPFATQPGSRMYRTGDLARRRGDGELEFLGRIDHQIKLRGFRIELGEIEAVLAGHPAVADAAVAVHGEQLVAYVVAIGTPPPVDALLASARAQLPDYMVPAAVMFLDELPLSPAGKLDRRALPAPDRRAFGAGDRALPRTPIEEILAGIWSEHLGVAAVGIHDNFFELGGHSLLAVRVVWAINRAFGVELPLARLFAGPTIAELAGALASASSGAPPVAVERTAELPLSHAQQRMWFLQQLDPESSAYNLATGYRLRGPLDVARLGAAIDAVVQRHEALRTVFPATRGVPHQVVRELVPRELAIDDLSQLPLADREAELARRSRVDASTPFDLASDDPIRRRLVRLGHDDHVLLLTMHHIACDGWSLDLVWDEIRRAYLGSALEPLALQYADFAAWQRAQLAGPALDAQLAYWRGRLADAPSELALPLKGPRPLRQTFAGDAVTLELDAELLGGLAAIARREHATLAMVALAVLRALLYRYTGQLDLCIGMPSANRGLAQLESMVGLFVNTLALRTIVDPDAGFTALVARERATALEAYAHQETPIEMVIDAVGVKRTLDRNPLFQILFQIVYEGSEPAPWGELAAAPLDRTRGATHLDLDIGGIVRDRGLELVFGYNSDLFDRETIAELARDFERVARAVAAAPGARVSTIPLVDADRERALVTATPVDFSARSFLPQLFEEQVDRTPGALAVTFEGVSISYRELDDRVNRLASYLIGLGARPEAPIGVRLERSTDLIVTLLAIVKTGAPYVPIDPAYPELRARSIIDDAGCAIVVDARWLESRRDAIAAAPARRPGRIPEAKQAAYIIFTSGTTGRPKGAAVAHDGLRNRLLWTSGAIAFAGDDVFLQKTPFTFDVSVFELFYPFVIGARLVVARPGGHRDPSYIAEVIREQSITYAHFVPSMLGPFLEVARARPCPSLRRVCCSGEALTTDLVRAFHEVIDAELHNLYGPTEATVEVSWWRCDTARDAPTVPIGFPTANTRLYVLDREHQVVPAGVTGDLYIAGVQLARGYVRRPGLTADRFVPDPFHPGERMYRTGDLARVRRDGAIEYVGRSDHQVKIRGLRIELEEIEQVLRGAAGVRDVVVVPRTRAGDAVLVAYVVGEAAPDVLRDHARARLPDYMVPATFVALDALPLTASGKTDRKLLPEPRWAEPRGERSRPRDAIEEILAGIWAELLELDAVGIHDNFFELGGHSLLAVRVVWAIQRAFGVELALGELFSRPTIAELAGAIANAGRGSPPAPVAGERTGELSYAQQRMWFLHELDPASAAYNIAVGIRFGGALDVDALRGALGDVARRHDILRTIYVAPDGVPRQRVVDVADWELPVSDASADELARLSQDDAVRPFALDRELPFRTRLVRLAADDHVLLATLHHIASDGWSDDVLWREIEACYRARRDRTPPVLAPLALQYADYAAWQRRTLAGDALDRQLAYWRARLAGAPQLLELPTDHPRPPRQSFRGDVVRLELDRELLIGLQAIGRRENATLVMTLLAGLRAVLARHTGQPELCIGIPTANRPSPELEQLVGLFVNTIVTRLAVEPSAGFAELVRRERIAALEAYAHQDAPFEMVIDALAVERALDRNPLFQVMFQLGFAADAGASWGELAVAPYARTRTTTQLDLDVSAVVHARGIAVAFAYATDLFDRATIGELAARFERLLRAAVAEPDRRLDRIPLIDARERAALVAARDVRDYADRPLVVEWIEQQVDRAPDAPAVTFAGTTIGYRELDARANRLAHHLIAAGARADVPIGVRLERSHELIATILAVLKTGAPYLPIDPSTPALRVESIVADAGCTLVIDAAYLADHAGDLAAAPRTRPRRAIDPAHAAYVIFTSGSTGRPKGVIVHHDGLRNRLRWVTDTFGFTADDVILHKTPFTFDVSVFELVFAFTCGARLVVAAPGGHRDPDYLARLVRDERVTYAHFVPSLLGPFVDVLRDRPCPTLRRVFASGEALTADLQRAFAAASDAELHNLYGPTEATIDVSWWPCTAPRDPIPIGRAIANTRLYVLDGELAPVAPGIAGELYIAGVQLARGYAGRGDLTAERFVPDPFHAGERMYRTGDLARIRRDGAIDYLGRVDHQVKLRGLRIELEEIEAALRSHAQVREAAVAVRADVLVAYVAGEVDEPALRAHLAARLPEYMVPAAFVALAALPLTASGKTDRKALPAPAFAAEAAYVAARSSVEAALVQIWERVLGRSHVGVRDRFFDVGGHSLLAIRLLSEINRTFRTAIPLAQIFTAPTIEQLALAVEAAGPKSTAATLSLAPGDVTSAPATVLQRVNHDFHRDDPANAFAHVAMGVELHGPLDRAIAARAIESLVRRHSILRTTYHERGGELVQRVEPHAAVPLESIEPAAIGELVHREFDLEHGPVMRAALVAHAPDHHAVILVVHHVGCDGPSIPTLLGELTELVGGNALPEPELQYVDYADYVARRAASPAGRTDLDYWQTQLADAPALELPVDFDRGPIDRRRDAAPRHVVCCATHDVSAQLDAAARARLAELARTGDASMMMVLLAGFAATLRELTGQTTLCVQTTVSQRHDRRLERVVGPVSNPVILRIEADAGRDVLVGRVRSTVTTAFERSATPILWSVAHGVRRLNFNYNRRAPAVGDGSAVIGRLQVRDFVVPLGAAKTPFDLHLWLFDGDDGIGLRMLGNAELFRRETCQRVLDRFVAQLAAWI